MSDLDRRLEVIREKMDLVSRAIREAEETLRGAAFVSVKHLPLAWDAEAGRIVHEPDGKKLMECPFAIRLAVAGLVEPLAEAAITAAENRLGLNQSDNLVNPLA